MMKLPFLFLLAIGAFAQMTTVTGKLAVPTEDLLNGTCSIQAAASFSSGSGYRILGAPVVVKFQNGILKVQLAPTDTVSPPGMYYRVQCTAPLQAINGHSAGPWTSPVWTWNVPTSSSPVDIGVVNTGALLNVIGLGNGSYCVTVAGGAVSGVSTGSCSSGTPLSWGTLTLAEWASLTGSAWSTLVH